VNWRRVLKSRDFHAAWIGVVLVTLAIVFDVVWIWALAVMGAVTAFIIIRWLVQLARPPSDSED
jgi:hypothetical protein